jgi:integrase
VAQTARRKRSRRAFGYIRKMPGGQYHASYLGPDGQRHNAPTTFSAKVDAETYLATVQAQIVEKRWKPTPSTSAPSVLTLAGYAEPWLADRQLKPRTRQLYRSLLDHHILPTLGDKPLASLTAADIRAWHAAQGRATPTATAHAYALLRTILGSAVDDDLIPSNPARIRGASQTKRLHRIEPATLEQLQTIIDNLPQRYGLMILLASWCALRFGELTELRRGDIDLKNGKINISRGVTWVKGQAVVGPPKSSAGVRGVAIPPHLLPVVRQHLADHVAWGKDALIFPAAFNGGQMGHGTFFKTWDKARKVAGRPDLRFHDLRHSGAVWAAQSGATLAELMGRLGHTTPAMAIRYQHIAQDRDAEIARRLSAMVEPKP